MYVWRNIVWKCAIMQYNAIYCTSRMYNVITEENHIYTHIHVRTNKPPTRTIKYFTCCHIYKYSFFMGVQSFIISYFFPRISIKIFSHNFLLVHFSIKYLYNYLQIENQSGKMKNKSIIHVYCSMYVTYMWMK